MVTDKDLMQLIEPRVRILGQAIIPFLFIAVSIYICTKINYNNYEKTSKEI